MSDPHLTEVNNVELNTTIIKKLFINPLFCFTSDLDWAPESMIEETLNIFLEYEIPLSPFITHNSKKIEEYYEGNNARHVCLHPNFAPNSTHGANVKEIVSHLVNLWPDARCFRSHSFVDSSLITKEFRDRGFKYDSNLCLHLQPYLVPLQHASGLLRFPVFFEDDTSANGEQVWELSNILDTLKAPGLKIFNFHPIHIALNTPSMDYYLGVKNDVNEKNWRDLAYKGKGVRTFLEELLQFVSDYQGLGIFFLDDLYSFVTSKSFRESTESSSHSFEIYEKSSVEQRAQIVRNIYENRDGKEIYATSRDFNLRELEIDFIINSIKENTNIKGQTIPKILDIGCGNGYTDICIAKMIKAEILGIDFSKEMISSAKNLRERFKDELISAPIFKIGDVRKLNWNDDYFDVVISERCLLNLPNRNIQYNVINEVHRVLKKGGIYIMVEGTRDGLRQLNELRLKLGLDAIPDIGKKDNVSSLKFEEEELEETLSKYFKIVKKQHFGMYYFISRVVHPLLVYPDQPKFDAKINKVARRIAAHEPDFKRLGHIVGYMCEAI